VANKAFSEHNRETVKNALFFEKTATFPRILFKQGNVLSDKMIACDLLGCTGPPSRPSPERGKEHIKGPSPPQRHSPQGKFAIPLGFASGTMTQTVGQFLAQEGIDENKEPYHSFARRFYFDFVCANG
jgi:hypothetical protein